MALSLIVQGLAGMPPFAFMVKLKRCKDIADPTLSSFELELTGGRREESYHFNGRESAFTTTLDGWDNASHVSD